MSITHRVGAAALAFAAIAATAGAQDDRPKPASCSGITFEDAAGDQRVSIGLVTVGGNQVPPPSPQKAKDNLDLRRGWFAYNAAGQLTANLQVTNLTKEIEQGANGASWYFYFGSGGFTRFVRAGLSSAGDVDYAFGTLSPSEDSPGNVDQGETTGRFIEGKDGIISIVVPVQEMQLSGETLTSPNGQAKISVRDPATGRGAVPTADTGPDDEVGADYEVGPCAEEGKGTVAQRDETPRNDRPAGGGGGTGGGSTTTTTGGGEQSTGGGGTAPPSAGITPIKLRVVAGRISARKATRKRRLSVRLIPGETITGLRATLYTGRASKPRIFATGRIAKLSKARSITLRTAKKRKLKKGTYTLAFTGRNAAGQTSTVSVQLLVRR